MRQHILPGIGLNTAANTASNASPKTLSNVARKLRYGLVFLGVSAILAVLFFSADALGDDRNRIRENVSVAGVPLAGLNRQQAAGKLAAAMETEIKKHRVVLRRGSQEWSYSYDKFGVVPDIEGAVTKAMDTGHSWNPLVRYSTLKKLRQRGLDLQLAYTMDKTKTEAVLAAVKDAVGQEPQNARLVFDSEGDLTVRPAVAGFTVDIDSLREDLRGVNLIKDSVLVLSGTETYPEVTAAEVAGLKPTGLMAVTTTRFNRGVPNRVNNIAVAAKALNNTLLAPGEEFSFNRVVGPRSADRGFQAANVIVRGKFTLDLGGGVCQVSSTLYNSVLKSGLAVTERSPHSLPVAYLPMGADATVAFGARDFKFRNNTKKYILIKSEVSSGSLTVQIIGDAERTAGKTVKIVSEKLCETPFKTLWVSDPALAKGQQKVDNPGSKGYVVRVYKITTFTDGTVKKELVNQSRYRPYARVILVGTKS